MTHSALETHDQVGGTNESDPGNNESSGFDASKLVQVDCDDIFSLIAGEDFVTDSD